VERINDLRFSEGDEINLISSINSHTSDGICPIHRCILIKKEAVCLRQQGNKLLHCSDNQSVSKEIHINQLITIPMTNTNIEPTGNGNSRYNLIIQDLCKNVVNAANIELQSHGKTINEEVVQKFCTIAIEHKLAPALSNWVDSTIPEPDETGCSESRISHDDMADFLRRKTQELEEAHVDQLVQEVVAVIENLDPKEIEEIMLHTPNPGFFESMTGLL
jgi:hypothetical protein